MHYFYTISKMQAIYFMLIIKTKRHNWHNRDVIVGISEIKANSFYLLQSQYWMHGKMSIAMLSTQNRDMVNSSLIACLFAILLEMIDKEMCDILLWNMWFILFLHYVESVPSYMDRSMRKSAFLHIRTEKAHLCSLIRAFIVHRQNYWTLQNACMVSRGPDNTLHMRKMILICAFCEWSKAFCRLIHPI